MRSRYTAYVLRNVSYLLASWHPSTRPVAIAPETIPDWNGLQIVRTENGSETDREGVVEFWATALVGERFCQMHEVSRFVKEGGLWFYRDGDLREEAAPGERGVQKVGRNDLCPCGSGRKFKKCCAP